MTTATAKKPKITVSHREAQMLLPTIPFEKHGEKLTAEQRAAVEHYIDCDECQTAGLNALLGLEPLTHQQAIEEWLCRDMTGLMSDAITPFSLGELRAIEHIFGRQFNKDKKTVPVGYIGRFGECQHGVCTKLRESSAPLSGSSIDQQADCHKVALLGYVEHGWGTKSLAAPQLQLLKRFVTQKGEGARHSFAAIDKLFTLIELASLPTQQPHTTRERTMLNTLELILHKDLMGGVCERFGKPGCGAYANTQDCGTNCRFSAMMSLRLHDFVRERFGIRRP